MNTMNKIFNLAVASVATTLIMSGCDDTYDSGNNDDKVVATSKNISSLQREVTI